MSRWMRDAVDDTGREIDELCDSLTAARRGYLSTLQNQLRRGCLMNAAIVCVLAAFGGHLEVLQWARANDCPYLKTLKWARANGCPWDKWTCAFAAKGGHLETLKWARANGCPDEYD